MEVGENQIKAEVRDGYHAGISGSDDHKIIEVKINANWDSRFEMNEMEKRFFDRASRLISELVPQFEVVTISGKKYRLDFAKIVKYGLSGEKILKIAIELDGHESHKTKEQRTKDAEREQDLKLNGWEVIRFTGTQIYKDIDHCVDVAAKLIENRIKERLSDDNSKSGRRRLNGPPILTSLKPDLVDPQLPGSIITWSAQATTDLDGDPIYYRFSLKGLTTRNTWRSMTDWTRSNVWTWKPTSADLGLNSVKVEIRDGYHEGPDKCDDWDTTDYRINRKILSLDSLDLQKAIAALIILIIFWMAWGFVTSNKLPEINSLTSNKYSPEFVHSTIIWTASALDNEKDTMLYKFWLKGPATGNTWNTMTSWTSNNSWIWGTSSEDVGENQIKVQVRDGKHAGADGFDAEKTASFTITKPSLVFSFQNNIAIFNR